MPPAAGLRDVDWSGRRMVTGRGFCAVAETSWCWWSHNLKPKPDDVNHQSTSHLWPTFSPSKAAISLLGVSALRIRTDPTTELEGDLTLQVLTLGPLDPNHTVTELRVLILRVIYINPIYVLRTLPMDGLGGMALYYWVYWVVDSREGDTPGLFPNCMVPGTESLY